MTSSVYKMITNVCKIFFSLCLLSGYIGTLLAYKATEAYSPLLLSEFPHDAEINTTYLVSEKLDGVRGLWNGKQMYFRSGKIMKLPQDFIKDFPAFPLDGELYSPTLHFNDIISILKNPARENEIINLKYYVFDVPFYASDNLLERLDSLRRFLDANPNSHIVIIPQIPMDSLNSIYDTLESVTKNGGEGLVIRTPNSPYEHKRSKNAFKLKKFKDSECKVIAHINGKGKYKDMLGSIVCEYDNKHFKIGSGFNDYQRKNPPPIGTMVTFKYQSLTPNGIPRFPVFLRVRVDE